MRAKGDRGDPELQALEFEWCEYECRWLEFLAHLERFERGHGHLRVPSRYVVDAGTPSSYRLGQTVADVRNKGIYLGAESNHAAARLTKLLDMGFMWHGASTSENERRMEHHRREVEAIAPPTVDLGIGIGFG